MYVYFGCICNQKCSGTYGCFENYQSSFLNRASHKAGNSSYFIRFTQYGRRKYYREGGGGCLYELHGRETANVHLRERKKEDCQLMASAKKRKWKSDKGDDKIRDKVMISILNFVRTFHVSYYEN